MVWPTQLNTLDTDSLNCYSMGNMTDEPTEPSVKAPDDFATYVDSLVASDPTVNRESRLLLKDALNAGVFRGLSQVASDPGSEITWGDLDPQSFGELAGNTDLIAHSRIETITKRIADITVQAVATGLLES